MIGYNYTFWEHWFSPQKVTFDGARRLITVNPTETTLDIRSDLYSAWVDWVVYETEENEKFLPAIRYTGLDRITDTTSTGDTYFLINGWKLQLDASKVKVTGILYSDNYETPFYTKEGVPQYPITVSSLVNTITVGGGGSGGGATVTEIRQEMDTNSTKLAQIKSLVESMNIPTVGETATAVWSAPISAMTDKTTIGGYISKLLLSVPKFLGLK